MSNFASSGRPVPLSHSLTSDAPGHSTSSTLPCWKCSGLGYTGTSKKRKPCTPCNQTGSLKAKKLRTSPGVKHQWGHLLINITPTRTFSPFDTSYIISQTSPPSSSSLSSLLSSPPPSTQTDTLDLSNYLGSYRLLQQPPGGHRYTTDDLLTAYIASKQNLAQCGEHLDLGCGNGSVLIGYNWLTKNIYKSLGVEARSEGVGLCEGSIIYNGIQKNVKVLRGDFRDHNELLSKVQKMLPSKPIIVTGTPPYFTVDSKNLNDGVTTIIQGGMPTNLSSAPARCEFRGGVECYIDAGFSVLGKGGRVVVCVNWLNRFRVYEECKRLKVYVLEEWEIVGGEGKGGLFGVWVMGREGGECFKRRITVRRGGKWTEEYMEIMREMGIPTVGVKDSYVEEEKKDKDKEKDEGKFT
ncbi:hypothetical protein TrLO_g591 [Triparma laevis f. longispina]|uniref:Uncharacterized protein n=1 Tax=Triparma laevis f. longispina TaxID=1714387 RepID=A0A9W7A9L6_9STRA|nr:hypothetical protein TrLO_g591 [Triparma laevis f. longispina]